jgi:radial spoke head protein 4A
VKIPDLLDDFNLLEWSGVSFGKGETYRLFLSIKKLAETLPGDVDHLRFFGKINTRGLPYYVVEGISPEEEEGIIETKQEGKSGANKYAYWVTQSLESVQWVKLPNVKMDQVVKARLFKRFLTGNLDEKVPSYPPFDGTERNLLRAQIARIVGATSISPDGFFDLSEDDPPEVKAAEAEQMNERFPKSSADLKDPEGWKHHEVELNKLGRITAMPEQLDENGEPIAEEEPVEVNPPLDTIKPENWTFRVCPGGSGTAGTSVVVARSLLWPGAVSVAANRKFVNVYVGNAVAFEVKPVPYSPPLPAPIQREWAPTEDSIQLVDNADVRVDPTPPAAEGEAEEE